MTFVVAYHAYTMRGWDGYFPCCGRAWPDKIVFPDRQSASDHLAAHRDPAHSGHQVAPLCPEHDLPWCSAPHQGAMS